MRAEFTIALDRATRTVRLTLTGFFMPADVLALATAVKVQYPQLGCAPNGHRTLLDVRAMEIQSRETLPAFTKILNDPTYQAERLAIVFAHTLVRMQITRLAATRDATRYFDDVDAAEAWLAEGQAAHSGSSLPQPEAFGSFNVVL